MTISVEDGNTMPTLLDILFHIVSIDLLLKVMLAVKDKEQRIEAGAYTDYGITSVELWR